MSVKKIFGKFLLVIILITLSTLLVAQFSQLATAVLLFLAGQFLLQFVLTPIRELKQIIAKIGVEVTFNENNLYLMSPLAEQDRDKELQERQLLQQKFRRLACLLEPTACKIVFYQFWSMLGLLPDFKNLQAARAELIGLSNSVYKDIRYINKLARQQYQHERVSKIRNYLELPDSGQLTEEFPQEAKELLIKEVLLRER